MSKEEALAQGFTHVVPTPDNRKVYYYRSKVQALRFAYEVGTEVFDLRYVELSPLSA